jgi:hypothetical protein
MRRKGLNKKSLETGGQQLNPAIQDLIQSSRSAIDMGATPKDLVLELSSSNIDSNDIQEVLISLGYTQDDVETIYSEIQEEQQKAQEEAQRQLQQRQQQNVTQYGGNLPQARFGTLYGLDGRATENVYRDPRRMYDNLPIQMPKSPIDVALNIASDAAFDPSNNFISRNFSKKDRNDDGLMDGRFFDRSAKKARRKLNRANLYDYEMYDKYGAGPDDQGIKIDMNSDNALSDQVKSKFSTNVYDVYDASKTGAPLKSKEQLEQDILKHSRIDFDTDSGQHFGYMSSRDIEPFLSKNPDLRNPATKASVSFEEYRNRFSPEQKENFIEQIQSMENANDGTTYGVDKEGFGASYAGLKDNPYLYDTMMGLNIENFNRPVVETDSKPPLDLSNRDVSDGPSWQQTQEEAAPLTFKQWYGQNADRLQNMSKKEIQDIYDSEKQEISEFDDYQSDDTSDDGYSFANAINAMLDYEGRAGGFNKATGKAYGLSNLGANKYTDLDPNDPNFREDLVARIDQDYGPLVKDFPNELKGPALDFYYNTGKDPRIYMLDQYLRDEYGDELANRSDYAGMMKDTRWLSPGMQEGFNRTYGQHADRLMGLNPEARLNLMNRGRDFYYQNINRVNNQPNPAYDATWKGRLDLYDPYFQPEMKLGGKIQNMKNRNLAIKKMGDEKKRALEKIPNITPLLKSSFNPQIQAVNTPSPKVNFTDSDGDGVADFYDPMTTGKSYYIQSPYQGASQDTAKYLIEQGVPNEMSRFIPAPKFRYGGLPKAQISPNLDFNKATTMLPLPLRTEKQLMEDAKKNYYRDPATLKLMSNFYSGENKGYNGEPVEVSLSGPDSPNLQLYADSVFSNNWWDTPSGIVTSGTPTAADTANMHFGTTWGDVPDDMPDRWFMSQNAWLVKDTENDSPFYEAIRKGVFPFKRYGGGLPKAQNNIRFKANQAGIDSNDLDEFDKNVALYKKFSEENPNSRSYDRHDGRGLTNPDWAQASDYIVDNANKLAPFLNAADAYKEDMFSRMGLSSGEIYKLWNQLGVDDSTGPAPIDPDGNVIDIPANYGPQNSYEEDYARRMISNALGNAPIGTRAAGYGDTAVSVAPNYAAGGQPFYDGYEGMLSEADIQRVYAMGGTVEFIN